jgi:hypothetical protein
MWEINNHWQKHTWVGWVCGKLYTSGMCGVIVWEFSVLSNVSIGIVQDSGKGINLKLIVLDIAQNNRHTPPVLFINKSQQNFLASNISKS